MSQHDAMGKPLSQGDICYHLGVNSKVLDLTALDVWELTGRQVEYLGPLDTVNVSGLLRDMLLFLYDMNELCKIRVNSGEVIITFPHKLMKLTGEPEAEPQTTEQEDKSYAHN